MSAARVSEWAVRHQLDRVDAAYHIHDDGSVIVQIIGRSDGKRTALWTHTMGQEHEQTLEDFMAAVAEMLHTVVACGPFDRLSLEQLLSYGTLLTVEENLKLL